MQTARRAREPQMHGGGPSAPAVYVQRDIAASNHTILTVSKDVPQKAILIATSEKPAMLLVTSATLATALILAAVLIISLNIPSGHTTADKLALCSMITLDYEAPYLLPWLAYHRLVGFDYVLLYVDDPTGTARAKHPNIFKALATVDWVRVETKCEVHVDGKGTDHLSLLRRCAASALELGVLWVGNWDVDEWIAFGAPVLDWPNSTHVDHVGKARGLTAELADVPSLKDHIKRITAQPTKGLVISRFGFSDNGHQLPKRYTLEVEAYTTRWGPTSSPGKLLWRLDSLGAPASTWFSTHEMFFKEKPGSSSERAPVRNMDGSPVRAAQTRAVSIPPASDGWAATAVGRDGSGPWAEADSRCVVRLHHHVQRSHAECVGKQTRMAALAQRDGTRGDFTWRVNDRYVCSNWSKPPASWLAVAGLEANSPAPLQIDHSLTRFGKVIRSAVVQLFTQNGLRASMEQLGARALQLSSPPRPEPEDAGLEQYIASLLCYTKRSKTAKTRFCDGHISTRVKCNWAQIIRYRDTFEAYRDTFEAKKFEECRAKDEVELQRMRQHNGNIPTTLTMFQRLLRCVVGSDVGVFRNACQCTVATCRWPFIAKVLDHPVVLKMAPCTLLRPKNVNDTLTRVGRF